MTKPRDELREVILAHYKKAYFNARTDVVGEQNGLLPNGSAHALEVLSNMTNNLLSQVDTYVKGIIGEDFTEVTGYDKVINGVLAMQRNRAGLEEDKDNE